MLREGRCGVLVSGLFGKVALGSGKRWWSVVGGIRAFAEGGGTQGEVDASMRGFRARIDGKAAQGCDAMRCDVSGERYVSSTRGECRDERERD
jgi:hypothetical protein